MADSPILRNVSIANMVGRPPPILSHEGNISSQGNLWEGHELYLRGEPWAVPLVATSVTNIASILAFEIYIVVRAIYGTPSLRHLFLGQCLLLGLIMTSLIGLPFALQPTPFTCAFSRFLVGAAPALVFGVLLVKCVFLISLNSGVYLPAHYQGLLLFFIILVQGVVSIQWLSSFPADVRFVGITSQNEVLLECQSTYKNYIISLFYVMSLIITVAAFAIKCRGIRENYRESSHIGASMGIILPMWLIWTLTGFILPQRLQPACLGFGSVITGTVVFLVMFIPKGRQMAAFGKDGVYREDKEERLSSLSGARYSPSFFLFQPVKSSKDVSKSSNYKNNSNDSIYKTNISDNLVCGAIPKPRYLPKPLPNIGQPFLYAPPKYAAHQSPLKIGSLAHYYQHYYPGSTCLSKIDEGIYTTIDPKCSFPANPNFYLFRSHSNAGMMY